MNRPIATSAKLLFVLGPVFQLTPGIAHAENATPLKESFENAVSAAQSLGNDYGLRAGGTSVIGSGITMGPISQLRWSFTLNAGIDYIFSVGGDSDVQEMDLSLFKQGAVAPFAHAVGKSDALAVKVDADDSVKAVIRVTKAKEPNVLTTILVLEKGRPKSSLGAVRKGIADLKIPEGYSLDTGYDDVCLFGASMDVGQTSSFTRTFRRGESYRISGGGGDNTKSLSVAVVARNDDGSDGARLGAGSGKTPVVEFGAGTEQDQRGIASVVIDAVKDPAQKSTPILVFLTKKR